MRYTNLLKVLILGVLLAGSLVAPLARAAGPRTRPACTCPAGQSCSSFASKSVTLTGTLIVLDATDANDQPYRPYALKLAAPLCVQGDAHLPADVPEHTDAKPTDTLQLAGSFNLQQAKSHLGRPQVVRGTLFKAETGWHVTPVLIDVQSLTNPAAAPPLRQ